MVLLAAQLAAHGAEAFLVPMYQKHEVFPLRPDFVLLNYLRHAHQSFLSACLAGGIRVGVLDTEGGIRSDFPILAQQVKPFLPGVTLYCVWGAVQRSVLAEVARDAGVCLVESGSPRYDFAVAPWRQSMPLRVAADAAVVLVNTNFPLVNSRFHGEEHELQEMVRCGWAEDVARRKVADARLARDEMIRVVRITAARCSHAQLVCRPHPFEDSITYEQAFSGLSNVCVRQEGSVFEWIAGARVLLHYNCSTAIEACMMDVEPIIIDWIDTPLLRLPETKAVSHRAASPESLVANVLKVLNGERLQASQEMQAARRNVIADYFHANDGRAAERVALAILDSLPGREDRISDARYVMRVCMSGGSIPVRAHRAATLTLGSGISRTIRDAARPSRMDRAKQFDASDIGSIVARLRQVHAPFETLAVSVATRHQTISSLAGGGLSVRIAAA